MLWPDCVIGCPLAVSGLLILQAIYSFYPAQGKSMTAIDTEGLLELLREVGAGLCETFWRSTPAASMDGMRAADMRVADMRVAGMRAADMRVADMRVADLRVAGVRAAGMRAADAMLRQQLAMDYPAIAWADGLLSEADAKRGEYWICNAVDGVPLFLRAMPGWCMSLTLMREGMPVFTAVYDAMHDEMFHAMWRHGAWYNGTPARVSTLHEHEQQAQNMVATRSLSPAALQMAYVACGRLDAFWQHGDDGYHCIGAALLIREAGGLATQADGQLYQLNSRGIAAASPGMHATILPRVRTMPVA
jgi:myo-inositol-1(or 4)-monophosphatase